MVHIVDLSLDCRIVVTNARAGVVIYLGSDLVALAAWVPSWLGCWLFVVEALLGSMAPVFVSKPVGPPLRVDLLLMLLIGRSW